MHEVYDFCVHIHVQAELLIIYCDDMENGERFFSFDISLLFPTFILVVLIRDLAFSKFSSLIRWVGGRRLLSAHFFSEFVK